jgi:hypothetical protein
MQIEKRGAATVISFRDAKIEITQPARDMIVNVQLVLGWCS